MIMLRFAVALVFCVAGSMGKCNIYKKYKELRSVGALTFRPSIGNMYPVELMCMLACNQMSTCHAFQLLRNATCEVVLSTMPCLAVDEGHSLYTTQQLKCPSGFDHTFLIERFMHNGQAVHSCYKLIFEKMTWVAARNNCYSQGGDLVSIESREEQMHLQDVVNKDQRAAQGYWTSGSDIEEEGKWKWMATGSILTYTNWDNGEPNNHGASGEPFLVLLNSNGLVWNDVSYSEILYSICEAHAIF